MHPGAERRGEELYSEARAPERDPVPNRLGEQRLLGREPGMLCFVVDAHRPAHCNDRVEPVDVRRQGLAFVELDPPQPCAPLEEYVFEDAGRLAGYVLEDEDVHAGQH
jgi:hypothetical protein